MDGKQIKRVKIDPKNYITLLHANDKNPQNRYYILAQTPDGSPVLHVMPAANIFFHAAYSEERVIPPGMSKPQGSKERTKDWLSYQRKLAFEGRKDQKLPKPTPTKGRSQKKSPEHQHPKFPFDDTANLIEYVTVILGMIDRNPADQDIIFKRLITQIKVDSKPLNERVPIHKTLRRFLDPIELEDDKVNCSPDDRNDWEEWNNKMEETLSLRDFYISKSTRSTIKDVWGYEISMDHIIQLRLCVNKTKHLIRYGVLQALFSYAACTSNTNANWDAEAVVDLIVKITDPIDIKEPGESNSPHPDEAWRLILRAIRNVLNRIYWKFRNDKTMAEEEIGGTVGEHENWNEVVGELAAAPDLHSAQELINRMMHYAHKMVSARSDATADSIGVVVGWIDEVLQK